jgi:ribosome-associated protein
MSESTNSIYIRDDELIFRASRGAGPGGQNVNKVNTRITLLFDIAHSSSLTRQQKQRIVSSLSGRFDKTGMLRIVSQKFRTQHANRIAAIERLQELLSQALKEKPVRHKTHIPKSAVQNRLKHKKQRSRIKQLRSEKDYDNF